MKKDRHAYLLAESKAERLSTNEIIEIDQAFDTIPVEKLRDLPENALAPDKLEEIGEHIINGTMENQNSTRPKNDQNSDRGIKNGLYPRSFYAGLKTQTANNGGHTVSFSERTFTSGYVVGKGLQGLKFTTKQFYSIVDLESTLNNFIRLWKICGFDGFGTWVSDGFVYIDPVTLVADRQAARKLCNARGEKSFYGIKEQACFNVASYCPIPDVFEVILANFFHS